MLKIRSSFVVAFIALLAAPALAEDLEGVKCVMNHKADAKASASADYMDGKVYFCCNNCAGKFKKDPEKYAAAANFQLVASKQYAQTSCPFSGGKINKEMTTKVGDVDVGFCCGGCKGKVEKADDDMAKINMVFAKASFKKGFKPAKDDDDEMDLTDVKCPMMGEDVSADFSADYMGGKVYFCCESCVEAFGEKEEKEKIANKLNMQLVQTKQFVQTSCPFSGGKVKDGTEVKVGDVEVGFCCNNCQGKVENADDDDAKLAMVFSKDAFKKGFEKAKKDKD